MLLNKKELDYIRANWKRHLSNPPFQYCDHLCEECFYTFCCSVYYDEKKRRLKILREGKDPTDPKVALEQVKECFSESFKAFKKIAKRNDINLEELRKKDGSEFYGRSPKNGRICREAERWVKKSLGIIDELAKEKDDVALYPLYHKLSKFDHYALMASSKIFRAMLFFYEEKDPDPEGAYDDAARSAALAICSLGFCSNVIRFVANIKMSEFGCQCAESVSLADKLESQLRKKFPDVDSYRLKIIFNSL